MIRDMRQWVKERQPDPFRQRQLDAIVKRERNKAFLHLYWEPGDWWYPVERWVIGHAIPRSLMALEYDFYRRMGGETEARESRYFELEGPNPRAGAYFDPKLGRIVRPQGSLLPGITYRQWKLWRETDAYVSPIWVVQGTSGGHKLSYNAFEQQIERMHRRPTEPPVMGELPYAPVDNRTIKAIVVARALNALQSTLREDFMQRITQPETHNEAEREFAKLYDSWFNDRVENTKVRPNTALERV